MTSALVADSVVNLCGALGLGVAMLSLRRRDPRGALTQRFQWALGLVMALFVLRGLAWWSGSIGLERLALACASTVPLGVLAVSEGALRRHAPRFVKLVVLIGSAVLALASLLGLAELTRLYDIGLAALQIATLITCGLLLARRDKTSLTKAENAGVDRLWLCIVLVLPFLFTDFRNLLPSMPVRLGGLGVLVMVGVVLIQSGGERTRRQGFALLALRCTTALLLAAVLAMSNGADAPETVRLGAILLSGFLAAGLMVDALRGLFEANSPGVLASIAQSRGRDRPALIADLSAHPVFESARHLREADLSEFDPDILRPALQGEQVLRAAQQPWGRDQADPATERLNALMATYSASHMLVIATEPLDLLLLTIPAVSADPATETALVLVRRMLATSPQGTSA